MFGFNNISLDKKSRFSFPAKYRDAFINSDENQIVITKDPQSVSYTHLTLPTILRV